MQLVSLRDEPTMITITKTNITQSVSVFSPLSHGVRLCLGVMGAGGAAGAGGGQHTTDRGI